MKKSQRNSIRPQKMERSTPTRGASVQGERQSAKGGPAGANQGGAPRGGSRIEPSHQKRALKKDQPRKSRSIARER
jgi:hypothetical protein